MFSSPWYGGLGEFQQCFPIVGSAGVEGGALQLLACSGRAHSPAAPLGFFHQDLSQLGPKCCDLIFAHKPPLQH